MLAAPAQTVVRGLMLEKVQAEVLGYVHTHRSTSPDLLRPLDLHSKQGYSSSTMGAGCSKSSSVGLTAQQVQEQPFLPQYSNSPYLADNASRKASHTTKLLPAAEPPLSTIQAYHGEQSSSNVTLPPSDLAANACVDASMPSSADAASVAGQVSSSLSSPSIVQQSLQEASVVYTQPMSRSPSTSRSPGKSLNSSNNVKQAIARHGTFAAALKAIGKEAAPDAAPPLLQHFLLGKKYVTVTDLDSMVAALAEQPAQSQAAFAGELIAQHYYFAAMKAAFPSPPVLSTVLQNIKQQVSGIHPSLAVSICSKYTVFISLIY